MIKILTIFYGGTGIFDKKDGFIYVEKESDLISWESKIPEISLIADTRDNLIIQKQRETIETDSVIKIATHIKEKIKEYDGVLIIHDVDSIPVLANQLFWLIQNPKKPIVITGSNVIEQETGLLADLSFKANLINAVQLINNGLKQISVIYGNRVIKAPKITRNALHDLNIFDSIDNTYSAKIDFGLSIEVENETKKETKYYNELNENFLFFETIPELKTLDTILSKNSGVEAIIFKSWPNQMINREKFVKIIKLSQKNKKIPILYSPVGFSKDFFKQTVVTVSKITPECLCAKLSWILGQTKDEQKIRELLKENIQGEFFE